MTKEEFENMRQLSKEDYEKMEKGTNKIRVTKSAIY